jgi:hypothetical protein
VAILRPVERSRAALMSDELSDELLRHARRTAGGHLAEVLAEAPIDVADERLAAFWTEWVVHHAPVPDLSVAEDYLRWGRRVIHREWLEARLASSLAVWEVLEVRPGEGVMVSDLLTGERRFAHDTLASTSLETGQAILASVVDFEGRSHLTICHPRALTRRKAEIIARGAREMLDVGAGEDAEGTFEAGTGLLVLWSDAPGAPPSGSAFVSDPADDGTVEAALAVARLVPIAAGDSEPSAWNELLDLVLAFSLLAPWRWMDDAHAFGVHDAEQDVTVYCSVLGAAGELSGLCAFDGPEGWRSFARMHSDELDPLDGPHEQHALTIWLSDREDVDKEMRSLLKKMGRRYRGRGAWPDVLVHRPGLVARRPRDLRQVSLLSRVLREAIEVCGRVLEEPALLDGEDFLVRRQGRDVREPEPLAPQEPPPVPAPDAITLGRLAKLPRAGGTWHGDHSYIPAAMSDGDPPYFPKQCIWLDMPSTFMLDMRLLAPDEQPDAALRASLLDLMTKHGRPDRVVVRRASVAAALAPLAGAVDVVHDPDPAVFLALREEMERTLWR